MNFGVWDPVVLFLLLLVLQSFQVSLLGKQPRSSAGALEADPVVAFDPFETKVPICENFTVNVTVTNVLALYAWKFDILYFKSTGMECLDFEEGPILRSGGTTQFVPPIINNTAGIITGANCSLVGASSGVNGNGTMAIISFHCKSAGQTILWLNNTHLYNSTSAEIYNDACYGSVKQIPTVTFRLLAVEKTFTNDTTTVQMPMRSAEYLVQSLTSFKNWQNGTWGDYNYRSYIHLLSSAQLSPQMLQYYEGQPNKTNILNEITTFLNDTGPGESNDLTIRIFYYCGHTWSTAVFGKPNVFLELGPPWGDTNISINATELDQALRSGDLGSSNCTLVILDSCYSGGYVTNSWNVTKLGRVVLTATDDEEEARGWVADDTCSSTALGNWSWFTGNKNALCKNGAAFGPLGIIGGFFNAEDWDSDGWRSAGEVFEFARNATKTYSESWANAWNDTVYENGWPVSVNETHPMDPTSWRGVAGGDIPLVMYSERCGIQGMDYNPFCYNGAPQWPPVATFSPIGWPMFGDDAGRGRFFPADGATSPDSRWTCSTLPVTSSAAVMDGMVFVGTLGGTGLQCSIFALAGTTGKAIWRFSADGTIYSSPAVADGFVFIGTLGGGGGGGGAGKLYALDEYTGRVRWEFAAPSGTGIFSSPAVIDGRVFISTMQVSSTLPCGIYALNETTGNPIWSFPTTTSVESSPTYANGRVFIGTMDGTIYALNASSANPPGQQLWNYTLSGNEIISTAAADNDSIYVGTIRSSAPGGGTICAFNQVAGGPPEWQFPPASPAPSPFSSSPAVDSGKNLIMISSEDGEVYALNRTNGNPVWFGHVGPINMSSAAISKDGLVYVGSIDGNLYCLNETTGATVWTCSAGGPVIASPALTDEHVIISSTGTAGNVQCIGPPFPVHDTVVYNLTVLPNTVTLGKPVNITCIVANNGNVNETFQVICLYNNTAIRAAPTYVDPTPMYTENVTLSPGTNTTIIFTWDTTDFASGDYTIIAIANPVSCETNTADNTFMDGTVQIIQSTGGGGDRMPYMT
jgi:outer membrane protein assembly factor BamB